MQLELWGHPGMLLNAAGRWVGLSLLTSVVVATGACSGSFSEDGNTPAGDRSKVQHLRSSIAEQRAELERQRHALASQEARLQRLESQLSSFTRSGAHSAMVSRPSGSPRLQGADSNVRYGRGEHLAVAADGRYLAQETEPVAPVPPVAPRTLPPSGAPVLPDKQEPEAPRVEDRPEAEEPTEQLLVERGGVLLPRGTLQLEPSVEYQHSSGNRVAISGFTIFDAIVIGNVRVDDLKRDIVTGALTARYGVTDRIQAEVRVPGVYRHDQEILGVGTNDERERSIDGIGLGDVESTLSYQALTQSTWQPATILRLNARFPTGKSAFDIDRETIGPGGEQRLTEAPTGSGFYGVGGGVTMVWRADPTVLFLGGSYHYNIARTFGEFGRIDPGDTIEWFAGTNVALTEVVSVNFSFVNQITDATEQNGQEASGTSTNDGRLVLGTSIGLSPRTSLVASASAGLTNDSPDFSFSVRLPITLQLFD